MPEGWCQLHIWGYWYFSWKTSVVSNYVRPTDSSPPGSPVPGILQARTLEWVAISFSNAWKWKVKVKSLSHVWFLATPWTTAYQAPPSMGFSRQEYWSELPLPSPQIPLAFEFRSLGILSSFARSPGCEAWCRSTNLHKSRRTSLVLSFSRLWVTSPAGMRFDLIVIVPLL